MSKKYSIKHIDGITRIQFHSKPTYEETKSVIDEVAENFPYERRMWNISNINFNFTTNEIIAISEYGKLKFTKPNKIALVAADDLAYGEMRQFMVYREQQGVNIAGVFRNEDDAIKWLSQ
ncbi:MAG: hypothetical protein OQK75_03170 [Gammaproteobacteria bacterium]|nr:hypothetical protein [Gammaproteobacteria bacterium]MCW8986649.1 hypothetical protein [Gammaproteobacteria bacterium]MCW9031645.1 hypothetical protein [Gammaproteobacteria bacterium]